MAECLSVVLMRTSTALESWMFPCSLRRYTPLVNICIVALIKLDSDDVSCERAMKAAFDIDNLCHGCHAVAHMH